MYVHPDDLEFDPENPRFGGLLSGKNQHELQAAIFGEPYYASELVDSFLENGYGDYEPLIVRRKHNSFVVIEGNRRLAAVRHIRSNLDQYPKRKSDLDAIPVLVFPESEDERQESAMRVYLGIRHLLGFREWPPLSKAVFLDRQSKNEGGLDQIIKEVRITKQQARRFLIPYRLMRTAGLKLPPGDDFWVLAEALQRAGVKAFVQLDVDPNNLEILSYSKQNLLQLLDDLYGNHKAGTNRRDPTTRRVKDTRDLSEYARVISSDKARLHLHRGKSIEEAAIYVDTREQSIRRLVKITEEMSLLVPKLVAGHSKESEAAALQQSFKQLESAVKAFLKKHA